MRRHVAVWTEQEHVLWFVSSTVCEPDHVADLQDIEVVMTAPLAPPAASRRQFHLEKPDPNRTVPASEAIVAEARPACIGTGPGAGPL